VDSLREWHHVVIAFSDVLIILSLLLLFINFQKIEHSIAHFNEVVIHHNLLGLRLMLCHFHRFFIFQVNELEEYIAFEHVLNLYEFYE